MNRIAMITAECCRLAVGRRITSGLEVTCRPQVGSTLRRRLGASIMLGGLLLAPTTRADSSTREAVQSKVNAEYPSLFELYKHLHANPELSFQEEKTSARVAEELKRAGYEVTTGVGKFGVVAVMKNGAGPTVLVRSDLDGLPVKEQTGLLYASKATTKDDSGADDNDLVPEAGEHRHRHPRDGLGDAQQRVAKLGILHSLGMLAVAGRMLAFP